MKKNNLLYLLLVLTGLLQTVGYVTQNRMVKGLGIASAASPLPIVFTKVKELETFSSDFRLEIISMEKDTTTIDITPGVYSRLEGPYNLRNVYGAAFAYGPLLPEEVRNNILSCGFCRHGRLAEELGIREPVREIKVHIKNQAGEKDQYWILPLKCH